MENLPEISPWGEIQHCDTICNNVFLITTSSHGGIMIKINLAKGLLSSSARKCGFIENGYYCFEEDTAKFVVFRELLDKRVWKMPEYIKDKNGYEKEINRIVEKYYPKYWKTRQKENKNNDVSS